MGMTKESNKASKREREEVEEEAAAETPADGGGDGPAKKAKKSKKERRSKSKSKKRDRRAREQADAIDADDDRRVAEDGAAADVAPDAEPAPPAAADAESAPEPAPHPDDATAPDAESLSKEERRAARAARKAEKAALESKIPTHDEDGIPYNKIQLRRMRRRVKHGLAPIATEEEEREIKERERRERAEEEKLYATTVDDDVDAADDDDEKEEDAAGDDADDDDAGDADDGGDAKGDDDMNNQRSDDRAAIDQYDGDAPPPKRKRHNPPSKGTKRNKPVPPDYVCQACKNQPPSPDEPFSPHWIYDCPLKQTRKGCNKVAKRLRGLHDPPSRKVFVSGLPFDCTEGAVKRFFEGDDGTTTLVHCKLLRFEDSKRCKGTAFLTFDSDDGARAALGMDGCAWKDVEEPGTKSKGKKKARREGKGGREGKELRLRVTKMKNRLATKRKGGKQQ